MNKAYIRNYFTTFLVCAFLFMGSNFEKPSTGSRKIDSQAVDGLEGVNNSLAYKVEEIERHFHNREKWFGAAASASGETHVADRMGGAILGFTCTSGVSDFGDWEQILGSSDTPVQADMAKFDFHRILVTTTNSTEPYVIQMIEGESAELAAKVAAEQFTEVPYIAPTNSNDAGIEEILTTRVSAGSKIWARCSCIGQTGKTINFYFGLHEYEG